MPDERMFRVRQAIRTPGWFSLKGCMMIGCVLRPPCGELWRRVAWSTLAWPCESHGPVHSTRGLGLPSSCFLLTDQRHVGPGQPAVTIQVGDAHVSKTHAGELADRDP